MEILHIPALRSPVMILAFGGWNDAGEAATGAASHLLNTWTASLIAQVDPEDFYDFQVNRPMVSVDDSKFRTLTWPTTEVFGIATPQYDFDLVVVKGIEPSMKWKTFAANILDLADDLDVTMILTLGSLLADTPHSRPISVSGSGTHPDIAERLGVEVSRYEGPTGILGVIQEAAQRRGIDAVSLWAAIPHYAAAPPSPKATLALINALEDFLNISLPPGDLPEQSQAWEKSVDEMAAEDSEISEYVRQLETARDESELPEATGDSIAREFERYLRRRNNE
ncbi:MAG TPA: PAC2 family protein [Candidatus Paceibacterota bacterium]|nr:PAC2 family protein [Candidatus Paceibacterota bacterium]